MTELAEITQQQTGRDKPQTARDLIQRQIPEIERQLAGTMSTDAFVRSAISSVSASPELQQASPASLLGGIMLAAQLRLEIGPALGHFYLTPKKSKGVWTCLPIIGFQGYIELAYRSGRIEKVESFLVRDGDYFVHGANSERGRFFDWTPADYEEERAWTGVVALAKIRDAGTVWSYLPRTKVEARRPGHWESTPWKSHPEQMACKTGIRALAPYLPKSVDLGRALEADGHRVERISDTGQLLITREDDTEDTLEAEQ